MKNKLTQKHLMILSIVLIFTITLTIPIQGIYGYLTDTGPTLDNNFTIALDPATTIVERYPTTTPDIDNKENSINFLKTVQIGNTGYIDCYVRVMLHFSDKDIRNKALFSADGTTYYSYAEYKNHLPQGWVYDDADDAFYYTPILYAGDWPEFSKNLLYDKQLGEYFYKDEDTNILSGNIITTPLIKYVKVKFDNPKDMRMFNLDVVEESVPFYLGNDYASAWAAYDEEIWELN